MNRVAVFAHYDKNCIIQKYVIFYLKELKKVVDKIVFVSDCDLQENELTKIQDYVDHCIVGRHGEYDFGSYKRGYLYLKDNNELNNYDELVFANDSCYAPLFPFSEMFDKMSKKNVDFWGDQHNRYLSVKGPNVKYIISYFVVFKQIVFQSGIFNSFICNIKKEQDKRSIVENYELGLTNLLETNGFTWDVYCQSSKVLRESPLLFFKETILTDKCLFLKRNLPIIFTKQMYSILNIKKFIKYSTHYDENLIDETLISSENTVTKISVLILYILCRNKVTRRLVMLYTNLKLNVLNFIKKKRI